MAAQEATAKRIKLDDAGGFPVTAEQWAHFDAEGYVVLDRFQVRTFLS